MSSESFVCEVSFPDLNRLSLPIIIFGGGLPNELGDGASVGGSSYSSLRGVNAVGVYRSLVSVSGDSSNEKSGVVARFILNIFSISPIGIKSSLLERVLFSLHPTECIFYI